MEYMKSIIKELAAGVPEKPTLGLGLVIIAAF